MSNHVKNLRFLIGDRQQKQVAEAAGVDQTWLNRVLNPEREDGIKQPRDSKLQPLALHFGLTIYELKEQDLQKDGRASQPAGIDAATLRSALTMVRRLTESMELEYGSGDEVGAIVRAYDHLASGGDYEDLAPAVLRYVDEQGGKFHVRRGTSATGSIRPDAKARKEAGNGRG